MIPFPPSPSPPSSTLRRLCCLLGSVVTAGLLAACGAETMSPATTATTTGSTTSSSTSTVATTSALGGSGGSGGSTSVGGQAGHGVTPGPVELDGVFNARHVGGLPTSDARHVRDRVLIRSGHLADLSATGCAQLAELGVRTVIDLRETDGATGVTANPDATCATASTSYLHVELPKILPPSETSYLQTFTAAEPQWPAIFGQLGAAEGVPAILHCVIGRDRASIVTAVVLLAAGVPADSVVADFLTNQDPQIQGTLDAAWMQAVVDEIEANGGIAAYLAAHGVDAEQLTAVQQALLE